MRREEEHILRATDFFKKNPLSISNMFFPCLSLYTIAIANLSNDNQQHLD